ncbi:hypothetical protein RRG08_008866 [Elysia crispata]|uniref:Uncharacterized protein n=1 Tax=Elysia crispata TaxID=231223 RepID=A0AAE0ZY02_9GAST|nr:hypothetical protein RRG08_008866 [Elysia crispata]
MTTRVMQTLNKSPGEISLGRRPSMSSFGVDISLNIDYPAQSIKRYSTLASSHMRPKIRTMLPRRPLEPMYHLQHVISRSEQVTVLCTRDLCKGYQPGGPSYEYSDAASYKPKFNDITWVTSFVFEVHF